MTLTDTQPRAEVRETKMPVRNADRILSEVARKHSMAPANILKPGRFKHLVIARQECMYRLLTETRMSSSWIGRFLRRDHTTVLEGGDRHAARFGLDLPRNRDIAR